VVEKANKNPGRAGRDKLPVKEPLPSCGGRGGNLWWFWNEKGEGIPIVTKKRKERLAAHQVNEMEITEQGEFFTRTGSFYALA